MTLEMSLMSRKEINYVDNVVCNFNWIVNFNDMLRIYKEIEHEESYLR